MNTVKRTRVTSSVSMHWELYKQVQDLAIEDGRTVSNMIAVLVKVGLEAKKNKKAEVVP